MCSYYDADDCRFAYVYSYDQSGKIEIRAQKERECPPQVYFMGTFNIFNLYKLLVKLCNILFRYYIGRHWCYSVNWNGSFAAMETINNN